MLYCYATELGVEQFFVKYNNKIILSSQNYCLITGFFNDPNTNPTISHLKRLSPPPPPHQKQYKAIVDRLTTKKRIYPIKYKSCPCRAGNIFNFRCKQIPVRLERRVHPPGPSSCVCSEIPPACWQYRHLSNSCSHIVKLRHYEQFSIVYTTRSWNSSPFIGTPAPFLRRDAVAGINSKLKHVLKKLIVVGRPGRDSYLVFKFLYLIILRGFAENFTLSKLKLGLG